MVSVVIVGTLLKVRGAAREQASARVRLAAQHTLHFTAAPRYPQVLGGFAAGFVARDLVQKRHPKQVG